MDATERERSRKPESVREAIMDLASERGVESEDELLERIHAAGYPDATFGDLIGADRGGHGQGLIAVLGLSEEEKRRISWAVRNEAFSNQA